MIFNYGFLFGFVLCFVCVSVRWDVPPLNQNSLDTVCGMLSTKLIHWCIVVDDNTITICIRPTKNRMSFAVKPAAGIENSLSMFCLVLDQSYPKKKKKRNVPKILSIFAEKKNWCQFHLIVWIVCQRHKMCNVRMAWYRNHVERRAMNCGLWWIVSNYNLKKKNIQTDEHSDCDRR